MSRSFTDRSEPGINAWQPTATMPSPVGWLCSSPRGAANALLVPVRSNKVWTSSLHVQLFANGLDLITQPLVFFELVRDLLDRMQGGGVVTSAEGLADGRQR